MADRNHRRALAYAKMRTELDALNDQRVIPLSMADYRAKLAQARREQRA